ARDLVEGIGARSRDFVLLRVRLYTHVPGTVVRAAGLPRRLAGDRGEGVRHQHGQPPQPSDLQGAEPDQLPSLERLEPDREPSVWRAIRPLRFLRLAGCRETFRVHPGSLRPRPVQVGHRGPQGAAGPRESPRGSQETGALKPSDARASSASRIIGAAAGGRSDPRAQPVFTRTTRSSGVMTPSTKRRRSPAKVAAPSRHALIPSKTARFWAETRIASSDTATAAPRVSRIALSTMRSASVVATRRPAAAVCGFGQGSMCSFPSFQALTRGAQPSAWMTPKRGHGASAHPRSRSSWRAFHIPTTPVPPPVGNRIQSGKPFNASQISKSIVFLPSTRYGSRNVARLKEPDDRASS